MGCHQFLDDGQAKTRSLHFSGTSCAAPIKPVENEREICLIDSLPVIRHDDPDPVRLAVGRHLNVALKRRVFDRIL
jgi:hypothetical protein